MMGLYEIMFIIRPDMETEEHEEVLDGLKNTITGNDGTVDKIIDWRRRRLAYEIEKTTEGHYYLLYFKGHGTIIPELEHFFKVNDAILRFLIGRAEEDYYEKAIAEEPEVKEAPAPEEPVEKDEAAVVVDGGQDVSADSGSGENVPESGQPAEADAEAETESDESVQPSESEQPSEDGEKE